MDTRERLREQRKKGWLSHGTFFGLSFGSGLWLGFSTCAGTSAGLGPVWAAVLVAYGLGGLSVLVYWWLADLRRKPSDKQPTTDH